MCFLFFLQIFSSKYFILRKIQQSIVINKHEASLKVSVFLLDFNQTVHLLDRFPKYPPPNSMKICPVGSELFYMDTDGRTDRHDEANSRFS